MPLDHVHCWACNSSLHIDQKFCTSCNHWQNWRRYTVFSASILSLLVALISVIGIVAPEVAKLVKSERANLDVGGQISMNYESSLLDGELILLVLNYGKNSVRIAKKIMCIPSVESFEWRGFKAVLGTIDSTVMLGGERKTIRYSVADETLINVDLLPNEYICNLEILNTDTKILEIRFEGGKIDAYKLY